MINNRNDVRENIASIYEEILEVNQKWHINPDGSRKDIDPEFYNRCIILMGCELSEAFEYLRKGSVQMDDHLPQYLGEYVEMVDLFIRAIDFIVFHPHRNILAGSLGICLESPFDDDQKIESDIDLYSRIDHSLALSYSDPIFVVEVIDLVIEYCDTKQIPLLEIYRAKTDYNRNRADHKAEARAAVGGKKF